MRKMLVAALVASAALAPVQAIAQQATINQSIAGTRLDVVATGEVTRVPDIAIISTGVETRATTAVAALQRTAARMERVRAALKAAGVNERDIQTSSINLNPDYRYENNQPPKLAGYAASTQLSVRFRDIANAGKIIDVLVAEGANQISGPTLTIDKPETALDEARVAALASGRARADLYARALGMRVVRLVAVSESGSGYSGPPRPMMVAMERGDAASSKIDPGEQKVQVNVAMTFELQR